MTRHTPTASEIAALSDQVEALARHDAGDTSREELGRRAQHLEHTACALRLHRVGAAARALGAVAAPAPGETVDGLSVACALDLLRRELELAVLAEQLRSVHHQLRNDAAAIQFAASLLERTEPPEVLSVIREALAQLVLDVDRLRLAIPTA